MNTFSDVYRHIINVNKLMKNTVIDIYLVMNNEIIIWSKYSSMISGIHRSLIFSLNKNFNRLDIIKNKSIRV